MNMENKQTQKIMKEKNRQVKEKLKEQIKKILLSGNMSVIKSNKNTRQLPRNCQLYRFACGMCKKKLKQKFSLKKQHKEQSLH